MAPGNRNALLVPTLTHQALSSCSFWCKREGRPDSHWMGHCRESEAVSVEICRCFLGHSLGHGAGRRVRERGRKGEGRQSLGVPDTWNQRGKNKITLTVGHIERYVTKIGVWLHVCWWKLTLILKVTKVTSTDKTCNSALCTLKQRFINQYFGSLVWHWIK